MEPKKGLVSQEIEDGLILYDPEKDESFVLNGTGAFIWQNISLDQRKIAQLLSKEFDVGLDQALADVKEFLALLRERGLLS